MSWHYSQSTPAEPYRIDKGRIVRAHLGPDGKEQLEPVLPHLLHVETVYRHAEEDATYYGIVVVRSVQTSEGVRRLVRRCVAPASAAQDASKIVGALARHDVAVTKRNAADLVEVILGMVQTCPVPRVTLVSSMGWHRPATTLVRVNEDADAPSTSAPRRQFVLGGTTVRRAGEPMLVQLDTHADQTVARPYRESGTWEGWLQGARLALPYPRAALALYASFYAPLKCSFGTPYNPVLQYVGSSSTGKSTVFRLAASVWGAPGDLLNGWGSSLPGFERYAATHSHLPIFMEELHKATVELLRVAYYDYANGSQRVVAAAGSQTQTRARRDYHGVLFSNGESDRTAEIGADGISARVINMDGTPVFGGPEDAGAFDIATRIGDVAGAHFGHAGGRWVQWLADNSGTAKKMLERFRCEVAELRHPEGAHGIQRRLAEQLVNLEATAMLVEHALRLGGDVPATFTAIWEQVMPRADATASSDHWDDVVARLASEAHLIDRHPQQNVHASQPMIGTMTTSGSVAVTTKWLRTALRDIDRGIALEGVLDRWRQAGKLEHDKGKRLKQTRWRGARPMMAVLKVGWSTVVGDDGDGAVPLPSVAQAVPEQGDEGDEWSFGAEGGW